jgi:non-ribosomal peptide synthetase component F
VLPDNLGYLFDAACALTPSKPAVFQGDTVLTYAELDGRVNRVANALAALG